MAKKKTTTKASAKKATATKPTAKKAPAKKTAKSTKLSALDAADKVLATAKQPINAKEVIEAMAKKKLWTCPGGKTPHATLISAILREIQAKGKDARFKKAERGKFAINR
jgi:hypothetical protein